jgi:hypothetical protein
VNKPGNISQGTSELLDTYLSTAKRWDALQSDADRGEQGFRGEPRGLQLLPGSDEGSAEIAS